MSDGFINKRKRHNAIGGQLLKLIWLLSLLVGVSPNNLLSQCSRVSTCGYTVYQQFTVLGVIPTATSCPLGYNYKLRVSYSITVVGTNTCTDGTISIFPKFFCNQGQSNGCHPIVLNAPKVGDKPTTISATGTFVTVDNPYVSEGDCNAITPMTLGCNSITAVSNGPGLLNGVTTCLAQLLSLRLVDFSSTVSNQLATLKWRTACEHNSNYFQINKYDELNKKWQPIGQVPAAGISNRLLDYSFMDPSRLTETSYYQLILINADGTANYSQTIAVESTDVTEFNGTIRFCNTLPMTFKGNYVIYDLTGTKVASGVAQNNVIHTDEFGPGLYFLTIEGSNGPIQYRMYKAE